MVSFLLIFYLAIVRLSGFLYPLETDPSIHGLAADWVYGWVGVQGVWANLLAALLLLVQAVTLNVLVIDHRLSDEFNLFPGVFFVLAASFLPEFQYLSPVIMANTFLAVALWQLFQTYRRPDCARQIFNTGFWLSVGSLFYPAFLFLLPLGIVGLNLLRAVKLREYLMFLSGALVPYLLLATTLFWYDRLPDLWLWQFRQSFDFGALRIPQDGWLYAKLGVFTLGLIVVLLSLNVYYFKKTMQVQKKVSILYWVLFLAGITLLFQSGIQLDHLLLLSIPFGILLALSFTTLERGIAEVLHLILLAGALFFQFWKYLF